MTIFFKNHSLFLLNWNESKFYKKKSEFFSESILFFKKAEKRQRFLKS